MCLNEGMHVHTHRHAYHLDKVRGSGEQLVVDIECYLFTKLGPPRGQNTEGHPRGSAKQRRHVRNSTPTSTHHRRDSLALPYCESRCLCVPVSHSKGRQLGETAKF